MSATRGTIQGIEALPYFTAGELAWLPCPRCGSRLLVVMETTGHVIGLERTLTNMLFAHIANECTQGYDAPQTDSFH
jgi:hypothetical protein